MSKALLPMSILLLLTISSTLVCAQELYKWVDEQGVTHYGDALPNEDIQHEAFKFTEYTQQSNPSDDYYSIHNQLQRLQERRAQSLKQKQQAAEIKAAANNKAGQEVLVTTYEPQQRYYSPAYFPGRFPKYYDKRQKYIPGHPYNVHYGKHTANNKAAVGRPRGGLVSQPKVNRSKAAYSKTK